MFNVARYLTDSLRGPVLQTLRRGHEVPEFDGTDGRDGRDGWTVTKNVKARAGVVLPDTIHETRYALAVRFGALDPEGSLSGNERH